MRTTIAILLSFLFYQFWSFGQNTVIQNILPFHHDTLNIEAPVIFNWSMAGIDVNNSRVMVRLVISEINENQTPGDAITLNSPFHVMDNLMIGSYTYPSGGQAFKEGHSYAWQVQEFYSGAKVNESEIYVFSFHVNSYSNDFAALSLKNEGRSYSCVGNKIYFKYKPSNINEEVNIKVKGPEGALNEFDLFNLSSHQNSSNPVQIDSFSEQYFEFTFPPNAPSGQYTIILENSKGRKYYLNARL